MYFESFESLSKITLSCERGKDSLRWAEPRGQLPAGTQNTAFFISVYLMYMKIFNGAKSGALSWAKRELCKNASNNTKNCACKKSKRNNGEILLAETRSRLPQHPHLHTRAKLRPWIEVFQIWGICRFLSTCVHMWCDISGMVAHPNIYVLCPPYSHSLKIILYPSPATYRLELIPWSRMWNFLHHVSAYKVLGWNFLKFITFVCDVMDRKERMGGKEVRGQTACRNQFSPFSTRV